MNDAFARDLHECLPAGSTPVLVIRRAGCGCRIAAVHRVGDRLVMVGRRRLLGESGVSELAPFLVDDLDDPRRPEDSGCRHSAGQLLDMAEIVARARTATRRGALYVVG